MGKEYIVLAFQWPSLGPRAHVPEDTFFVNGARGVFVVADGVTRRGWTSSYPDPSPARLAAELVVATLGEQLSVAGVRSLGTLAEAFRAANDAVRQLNVELGYWDKTNYWDRDLAGAVAAALVLDEERALYAFLGDCGVARVSARGGLLFLTPDEVAGVTSAHPFRSLSQEGERERFVRVRRDFRNHPAAPYPTYGVLTGEDAALAYVRVGAEPVTRGDAVAVFSDGAQPFIIEDKPFRFLLANGTREEITKYVKDHASPKRRGDEKTLIVVRI